MISQTEIKYWSGLLEFRKKSGCNSTSAKPPWWIIKYRGTYPKSKWTYNLVSTLGPPELFLTRRMAREKTKILRQAYSLLKFKIVRVMPL